MREEVGFGERVVSLPRLLPLRAPRQQGVQRRKHKSPTLAGVRLLVRVYELLLLAGCCAVLLPPLALLRRDASARLALKLSATRHQMPYAAEWLPHHLGGLHDSHREVPLIA